MALIPLTNPNANLSFTTATAGGEEFANDPRTLLIVLNASGASRTITIAAQRTSVTVPAFGVLTISNIAVTMSGNGNATMQASPGGYNNNTNGRADVTVNTAAGISYAAVRLANVG